MNTDLQDSLKFNCFFTVLAFISIGCDNSVLTKVTTNCQLWEHGVMAKERKGMMGQEIQVVNNQIGSNYPPYSFSHCILKSQLSVKRFFFFTAGYAGPNLEI